MGEKGKITGQSNSELVFVALAFLPSSLMIPETNSGNLLGSKLSTLSTKNEEMEIEESKLSIPKLIPRSRKRKSCN